MSKTAKIFLAIGFTVVLLLIGLVILIRVVVTPEKVRENLLPLAEETLQRKIELGQIDIGLLSGVSLTDLRVQKRQSAGDFISVKSLVLKYELLPLLSGQLVIDQVLLDSPRIEIVRQQDGRFNFSDLLAEESAGDKQKGAAGETATAANDQASSAGSPLNLLVNQVTISGGELLFVDRSQNGSSPYRYSFDRFNFKASQLTLEGAFPVEMSAQLNGSPLTLTGRVNVADLGGDLELELRSLDLIKFAPYYRQSLPGNLGSGALGLNLEVQFNDRQIDSKGMLQLDQLDLVLDALPEAALQQASVKVEYAMNFDRKQQQIKLSTLQVDFNDAVIGAEGMVDLAASEPTLDLTLLLDQLDLRTLFGALPVGLTREYQAYSLAGALDARVHLRGSAADGAGLLQSAQLKLGDVNATVEGLRAGLSGQIDYAGAQVEAKQLQVRIADQQLAIDFNATGLFDPVIRGDFLVSAKQLDVNRMLPANSKTGSADPGNATAEQPKVQRQPTVADELGPFDLPLDMTGRLRVDQLLYEKLTIERVEADMALKKNHLLIDPLRGDVAGGQFLANCDVDLGVKGLRYQGQMKLDQSNLLGLLSGLVPQSGQSVSGLLQWQNNFSGSGTLPDNLLHSLQVKGLLQLQQGQISGSPLLEQLAAFLGLPDLKVLDFDALESRYDMRNGLASLSGELNSSKAKLAPKGTVGVDGGLDLTLDARIAPELMQRLGVKTGLKQALSDQDGWGILPLAIKGNLSSPKIAFDQAALKKQAVGKAKQEVSKRLLEKVAPAGAAEQEPVRQLLEGTLNKLFGN